MSISIIALFSIFKNSITANIFDNTLTISITKFIIITIFIIYTLNTTLLNRTFFTTITFTIIRSSLTDAARTFIIYCAFNSIITIIFIICILATITSTNVISTRIIIITFTIIKLIFIGLSLKIKQKLSPLLRLNYLKN